MVDRSSPLNSTEGGLRTRDPVLDAELPEEPFACPHCGQMLAPSCRVCVACKQPVDPAEARRHVAIRAALDSRETLPSTEAARFSWQIFFMVLAAWLLAALAAQQLLGPLKSQVLLGSVVFLSSAWVSFDAHEKGVAKPLRWGLGSLLLWIVVFPWYLSRRKTPKSPCPFIEAETGPLARALLFALVVFFLLSAVLMIFKGPLPQ